jgi:dCTP deaminase
MSVIALTIDGDTPIVVTHRDNFADDGEAILIQGADLNQLLTAAGGCNASYDLGVGPRYRDHRYPSSGDPLDEGESTKLLPGNAVIIETEEVVRFPLRRFGQILPRVTLLQKGIANTPSKVDPGYNRRLLITAFNHGKQPVKLTRGERFCSLHIFDIAGAIRPYDGAGKSLQNRPKLKWRRIFDWIDLHSGAIALISAILMFGLGILELFFR